MLLIFSGGPREVLCVSANLFITVQLNLHFFKRYITLMNLKAHDYKQGTLPTLPEERTGDEEIDTDEKSTQRPSSSSNRKA
jgi:hypothetical protein